MAYKKNVDDMRESPSLVLTELLEAEGADVSYFDPHVKVFRLAGNIVTWLGGRSEIDDAQLLATDCVLYSADHDGVDYRLKAFARVANDT